MADTPAKTWQPLPAPFDLKLWAYQAGRSGLPLRAVAIGLKDGGLAIYSAHPKASAEVNAALSTLGTPTIAIAPNHFHYLGIPALAEAFNDVTVVASERATPRLRKKLKGMTVAGLDRLREQLPEQVKILEPAGTKNGEVWLSVATRQERAWIVCDAFFNAPEHPRGMMGLACKWTRTTKGLQIGNTWKWLGLADNVAYRDWLVDALANDPPTMLVMSHGDILSGPELAMRLTQLVAARL